MDRDMYMQYAGNGIGHYKVDLVDNPKMAASSHEPNIAEEVVPIEEDVVTTEGAALGEIEPESHSAALGEMDDDADDDQEADHEGEDDEELNDEELEDEEEDDGEGDGEDDNEDDLGAEDGEGGFVILRMMKAMLLCSR